MYMNVLCQALEDMLWSMPSVALDK